MNNTLDEQLVSILAELVADPKTTEPLRVQLINKLLESKEGDSFFQTMFESQIGFGACPDCGHENHWLVPEDELNKLGHVTARKDTRVKSATTAEDCPEFQEACGKRKINA